MATCARSYANFTTEKLAYSLDDEDTAHILECDDVNLCWLAINMLPQKHADIHCPYHNTKLHTELWLCLTPNLIELLKDRDCFLRKAKTTEDPDHWDLVWAIRNKANRAVWSGKECFIKATL